MKYFLFFGGVLLTGLAYFGILPSSRESLCILLGSAGVAMVHARRRERQLLTPLMIVIYVLPFTATLGLLADENYLFYDSRAAVALIQDSAVMKHMLAVGVIGLVGLLCGMFWAPHGDREHGTHNVSHIPAPWMKTPTLGLGGFIAVLALALLLRSMAAAGASILDAPYASNVYTNYFSQINFQSASMLSLVCVLLLFIDYEREPSGAASRRSKRWMLWAGGGAIVIMGLVMGTRDSSGLLAALGALYATGERGRLGHMAECAVRSKRLKSLAVWLMLVVPIYVVLGEARLILYERSALAEGELGEWLGNGLRNSTWRGVLLTNLGISGQYRELGWQYLYGRTYLDYVMSLPPGMITKALGVTRPIELEQSPGLWTAGVSQGGIHIVVVPFKNFGVFGVFAILGIYGYVIALVERRNAVGSFWRRLTYGAFVCISFTWFWYGDMSFVRGMMAAVLLGAAYRLAVKRRGETGRAEGSGGLRTGRYISGVLPRGRGLEGQYVNK